LKIPARLWIPAVCVGLLTLTIAVCWPRRNQDILVGFVAVWNMSMQPSQLVFAVTNSRSTVIEVAVGPKMQRPPDWPRGESATLSPGCGSHLHAYILNLPQPWTISVKARRIAGKFEKWLRSHGASVRLCDATPGWRQVQTLEVKINDAGVADVRDKR
jgi:hypothetical protein